MAFALPDMSCNREAESTAEQTRSGYHREDWGVAAFAVQDIPPREQLIHLAQFYRLLARHIPLPGNHAHSEVRVWRMLDNVELLLTLRGDDTFGVDDPDAACTRGDPSDWLDPDFHMRWRRRIAQIADLVLGPSGDGIDNR